jgi:outer membrane protein TolC
LLTNKKSLPEFCYGIIIFAFLAATTGCSTNSLALRKTELTKFNDEIALKTSQVLSKDKTYDLNSCIQIALENNLDIRIAEINSRLAKLDKKIAFTYFLPQVDITATRTDTDKYQMRYTGSSYMAMSDQETRVTVINGQLAIFNPETWFLYSAYSKGDDIQGLINTRVKQGIRLQVTALYLSCLSLESAYAAAESASAQAEALLKEMEALHKEGMILKSDLEKAQAFKAMQQNNLSEVKRQKIYAKAELLEAMGLYPLSEITLGAPPSLSIDERELSEMITTALLNRPELMAADLGIEAKGDSLKMAISAFLPKIFLIGDFTNNRDSFLKYSDILTYGASGILTVFDGFANIYKYKAAKQEKAQAMVEREQACVKIMLEVINAKQAFDREADNRERLKLELDSAKSSLNETMSLWKEGMVTSSKKLESATYYTSIKSNMELADYRYQVAAATMADVMGITGKE